MGPRGLPAPRVPEHPLALPSSPCCSDCCSWPGPDSTGAGGPEHPYGTDRGQFIFSTIPVPPAPLLGACTVFFTGALVIPCFSSFSGRSLPCHHRAAKAGKDVTQVRAGIAVTPCSHGIGCGPPLADPLFASAAGIPVSVRLRGPFTWGAAGSIQREGAQDLSHCQGERCPGEGMGQRLQPVCASTGRVP